MGRQNLLGVSEALLGEEEALAVADVVRSGWISQGEGVKAFEAAFSAMYENRHSVAVCNATAGLHLALHALGAGPGDIVLVPGLTFVGAVNAVLYTGAQALPVDIVDTEHPHISLEAAARALTPSVKGIMVMHHGGYAVDMDAWSRFAAEHGLFLLEDAAHAPGLSVVGRYSHAAVFSFFANKNMTTAEGGIILTRDATLAERLRRLRGHAMSAPTLSRAQGHTFTYDVDELGFNYRMDDIRAALGRVQLEKLPTHNARRCALSLCYRALLADSIPAARPFFDARHETTGHLFSLLLPTGVGREAIMTALRTAGIQTSIHYPPYYRFAWHGSHLPPCSLPMTDEYCHRTLSLPLHAAMDDADVTRVVAALALALRAEARKEHRV